MTDSRSYARTRVAVAPGDSTSSLKKSATATRRWTREETLARVATGPEFRHLNPTPTQLDDLVRGYEQATGVRVRRQPQRNLIAACYRVHGDDFLLLVRQWFARTGTTTNLLGELRVLPPRELGPIQAAPGSTGNVEPDAPGSSAPTPEPEARRWVLASPGGQYEDPTEPTAPSKGEDARHDADTRGAREPERHQLPDQAPRPPVQTPGSRPPDCPYPRHEPTWVQRPDGTWRCGTCHP
jgi:hypothetical protein